jgi:small subunit ribosomal protein S2
MAKKKKEKADEEKEETEEAETPVEKPAVEAEEIIVKEKEELLVPLEEYIGAAVHLGTKAITPGMRRFVYKRRADGIAVLNTKKIDEKIIAAASLLAQFAPGKIMLCCKREAGHKALESFGRITGVKIFKRYPAGLITNPKLEDFYEPQILLVVDPWLDKNAVYDAVKIKVPVVALCDANNPTAYVEVVVPCNNKTAKSIGLMLYLIAKLYVEKRGLSERVRASDFYVLEEEGEKRGMREEFKVAPEEKEKEREAILKKIKEKKAELEEKKALLKKKAEEKAAEEASKEKPSEEIVAGKEKEE